MEEIGGGGTDVGPMQMATALATLRWRPHCGWSGGERQALKVEWDEEKSARGGFQNTNHGRRNYGDQGQRRQAARGQPTMETVHCRHYDGL